MKSDNLGVELLLLGVIGGVAYLAFRQLSSHGGTTTKYQVGDVLYNPPDTQDTFKITGFQEINGVLYYTFLQMQDGVSFVEPVSLIDGSSAWAKQG